MTRRGQKRTPFPSTQPLELRQHRLQELNISGHNGLVSGRGILYGQDSSHITRLEEVPQTENSVPIQIIIKSKLAKHHIENLGGY